MNGATFRLVGQAVRLLGGTATVQGIWACMQEPERVLDEMDECSDGPTLGLSPPSGMFVGGDHLSADACGAIVCMLVQLQRHMPQQQLRPPPVRVWHRGALRGTVRHGDIVIAAGAPSTPGTTSR